jgi:hypothetical protein
LFIPPLVGRSDAAEGSVGVGFGLWKLRHPEAAAKRPSKDAAGILILRGSLRSHLRITAFWIPASVVR